MSKKPILAGAIAAAVLAAPAAAQAHVTVNPREVTAGSFSVMTVRVPNERDNKGTVKVDVRFPDGFYSLSYKKVPGWNGQDHAREARPAGRPRRVLGRQPGQARRLDGPPEARRDHQARPVRGVPDLRPRARRAPPARR